MGQMGLFDLDNRMAKIATKDPLIRLNEAIDWNIFHQPLKKVRKKERKSNAGRRPFDALMMFKVLILQRLYNLSDEQTEYQLRDRLSFFRFVGLGSEDVIPDEKTIWLFREQLKELELVEELFSRFDQYLSSHGYAAQKGQIIDASFVEVPRQRNSREENETIKGGSVPESWEKNPAKLNQKDVEARWTKKNERDYYGYKNHVNVDVKNKLIRQYAITSAEVHDSQKFEDLLDPWNTNGSVWADSAYDSEANRAHLEEMICKNRIHRKGRRNRPLSAFQQEQNTKKSKTRALVEHTFAFFRTSMRLRVLRGIGKARAVVKITLMNLIYNLCRYTYLQKIRTA